MKSTAVMKSVKTDLFCHRQISLHLSSFIDSQKTRTLFAQSSCKIFFDLSLGVLATPFDIVHLSCDIVRYREYREYRPIKCCTKFAPKSHQHSTPIQLDKLKFGNVLSKFSLLLYF